MQRVEQLVFWYNTNSSSPLDYHHVVVTEQPSSMFNTMMFEQYSKPPMVSINCADVGSGRNHSNSLF